jgi:sulfite exporter TauE/SafE
MPLPFSTSARSQSSRIAMTLEMVLASGFLTGLASSLHCAGLCGGVASMMLAGNGRSGSAAIGRLSFLTRMQVGRAMVYIVAGSLAGSVGFFFQSLLFLAGLQNVLRLAAAAAMIGMGLSVAGILPPLGRLDANLRRLASSFPNLLPRRQAASPIALGAVLAMAPCAMVFNALLTAMMVGTPFSGALYMAGFALAALPGVVFSGFGISQLARSGRGTATFRQSVGLLLAATGVLYALVPEASMSGLCLT